MAMIGGAWRPGGSYFPTSQFSGAQFTPAPGGGIPNQYSPQATIGQGYSALGGGIGAGQVSLVDSHGVVVFPKLPTPDDLRPPPPVGPLIPDPRRPGGSNAVVHGERAMRRWRDWLDRMYGKWVELEDDWHDRHGRGEVMPSDETARLRTKVHMKNYQHGEPALSDLLEALALTGSPGRLEEFEGPDGPVEEVANCKMTLEQFIESAHKALMESILDISDYNVFHASGPDDIERAFREQDKALKEAETLASEAKKTLFKPKVRKGRKEAVTRRNPWNSALSRPQ